MVDFVRQELEGWLFENSTPNNIALVASGSFSSVYKITLKNGRIVAAKVFNRELSCNVHKKEVHFLTVTPLNEIEINGMHRHHFIL